MWTGVQANSSSAKSRSAHSVCDIFSKIKGERHRKSFYLTRNYMITAEVIVTQTFRQAPGSKTLLQQMELLGPGIRETASVRAMAWREEQSKIARMPGIPDNYLQGKGSKVPAIRY